MAVACGVTVIPNPALDESFGISERSGMDEKLTIGSYRELAGLKIADLAAKLGISKGHASDLCNGKYPVNRRIAGRLEQLSGIPWYRWMDEAA